MILDLSLISVLLVVAQLIRAGLPLLGRIMLPTSILAGVLGLACGPQGLDVLPFTMTEDREGLNIALYPSVLVALVFATLLMGADRTRLGGWRGFHRVRHMFAYSLAAEMGQYGLAILLGVAALAAAYPQLPEHFSVMLAAGFAGGHGTASVFSQGFAAAGWSDSLSVGYAFATTGLLVSIFGGVLLLNLGARRGWTAGEVRTSRDPQPTFVEAGRQFSIGSAVTNPSALDPLAWHITLVATAYGLAVAADAAIHWAIPGDYWLPVFALAMMSGALLQRAMDAIGYGQFIDTATIRRIGSTCADFLVACGVASIKLSVVREHAGAMLLLSVFGCLYSLAVFCAAPLFFGKAWYERAILTWGWLTGTLGIGVALLRTIDPQFRSRALEDYGAAYIVIGPIEMMLYPAIVWACVAGHSLAVGMLLTLAAAVLFGSARCRAPDAASAAGPSAEPELIGTIPIQL